MIAPQYYAIRTLPLLFKGICETNLKTYTRRDKRVSSLPHYLVCLVTSTNEVETEIKARIIAGNKRYLSLGHVLRKDI
jgi:hypothetical protein